MGQRVRALTLLVVLLGAGTLLGSGLAQWWPGTTEVPEAAPPRPEGRVRVEVLNGGGIQGIARSATRALRDSGFEVGYYGNAETFTQEGSVVLDRVGRPEVAEGVAEARIVRTGIRTETRVEITEGLELGDRVIVSAIQRLRTGLPIETTSEDAS